MKRKRHEAQPQHSSSDEDDQYSFTDDISSDSGSSSDSSEGLNTRHQMVTSNEITVSSSDDDDDDGSDGDDSDGDGDDSDGDGDDSGDEKPAFEIVEDVHNRDEYAEFYETARKKIEKRKRRRREQENEHQQQKKKLPVIEDAGNEESDAAPVKVVKPFDYAKMRKMEKQRGVIYVMRPESRMLQNERQVREYFSEFGTITRLQSHSASKSGRSNWVRGFYVEFEDREIAKQVALSTNNSAISPKSSALLMVKYMPNFQWAQQSSRDERVNMYKKLLRAEADKELRAIKSYKKNKKLSDQIRQNKIKRPSKRFKIVQRRAKIGGDEGSDIHLDLLPVFGDASRKKKKKKN